jgi:hypothetical protein
MKELFDTKDKIIKLVLDELDTPHYGLLEEALGFFLLDGIGEVDKLKAIYDDAKKRIKVY